jgi:predicted phosphoribosyltransferase
LLERDLKVDVVLGLPRGGVVVAAEVARFLKSPLDVLVVRKIGHPLHREFAIGALAEYGVVILDERMIGPDELLRTQVDAIVEEEEERLRRYRLKFRGRLKFNLADACVLVVDDGLATGATTEAAVLSVRRQGGAEVFVAAPVASLEAVERLKRVADDVMVLLTDPGFDAVGRYYDSFPQTTDEEVLALLKEESRKGE